MRRRSLVAALGVASQWPALLRAQPARQYRVGILETVSAERNAANLEGLRRGLRERGYVEGKNLKLEYRSADGEPARFPDLARDLVTLGVDLIVTRGTPAARAAKGATHTIPIVMAAIGEPLGVGVVESLARPGENVTGLSAFVTELAGKRVELLKGSFPTIASVGFMVNMENPVSPPQWEATQVAAKAFGLAAELFDVRSAQHIKEAFDRIGARTHIALSLGIDAVTQAGAAAIVASAAEHRLPTAYPAREFVDIGGLMSYGPSYVDLYVRAAGMIDKIFKGAKPAEMPVEQPTKLELVINLKTAKVLDLSIPSLILARADEVIE